MTVAIPLDLPKIEPDDWNVFWNIWKTHSGPLHKKIMQHHNKSPALVGSNNIWHGLDIIKTPNGFTSWEAPHYDIKKDLPKMYDLIMSVDPTAFRVRLVQSTTNIVAHTDDDRNKWNIRAFLHYTSDTSQWYFTKPNDSTGQRTYLKMPKDTNWFIYNDKHSWHGTDYDPNNKKILLQIYSFYSKTDLLEQGIKKYKDFVIKF